MEAASIISEDKTVDANNLIPINKHLSLLTSAAVYGANASGKSNLIIALAFMRKLVINSARESQAEEPIKVEPYRLNSSSENKPAYFEMIFLIENQKYRYGFEVSKERIEREWLYYTPTIREAELFTRQGAEIKSNPRTFREGHGLEARTRPNALFLSVAAQFNGPVAQKVLKWFRRIGLVSGLNDTGYRSFTLQSFLDDSHLRDEILKLVRSLDVGVEDISVKKNDEVSVSFPPDMPDKMKDSLLKSSGLLFSTQMAHTKYDNDGQPIGQENFDLEGNESEGTQKLFFLSGPILNTLMEGEILVVDEMEARMHPLITYALIQLFNSLETNPRRAQLIFTTHDTNLLNRSLFRRDQIWFVEKDSFGASHLYSLVEFKPRTRNDESFERNYLRGKYGAIPYLRGFYGILDEGLKIPVEESGDGA
jgi:hypothetical protein